MKAVLVFCLASICLSAEAAVVGDSFVVPEAGGARVAVAGDNLDEAEKSEAGEVPVAEGLFVAKSSLAEAVPVSDTLAVGDGLKISPGQRAVGLGHSVSAESADHCAALCADHVGCDAVNFHKPSKKCRFFHRCVQYTLHPDSDDFIHFSKRPSLKEKGWVYDSGSNTCLKVFGPASLWLTGAKRCAAAGGRLAALTGPELNRLAAKLLRNEAVQYAWIGLRDSNIEGNPVHVTGEKVSSTGYFPRAPQQHRNDAKRNCWSISDTGEWAEHSCKKRRQLSVCQITPFAL